MCSCWLLADYARLYESPGGVVLIVKKFSAKVRMQFSPTDVIKGSYKSCCEQHKGAVSDNRDPVSAQRKNITWRLTEVSEMSHSTYLWRKMNCICVDIYVYD